MKENLILIIDDEKTARSAFQMTLQQFLTNTEIITAKNSEEGLKLFFEKKPNIVLLDIMMPGVGGMEVLNTIGLNFPDTPVIIISGLFDGGNLITKVMKLGACDYLCKPINNDVLIKAINFALNRTKLIEKTRKDNGALSGILSICTHCKNIRDNQDVWKQIETYISQHSEVKFSHGICPNCKEEHYSEYC